MLPVLHLSVVQPVCGILGVSLPGVAAILGGARAFQRHSVRRLGTGLLLWLRFGGGRGFHGLVDLAGMGAADWVHHMKRRSAECGRALGNCAGVSNRW